MSAPDPVRILQLTDPHLFADAAGTLRGQNTLDSLAAVVRHVSRQDWSADIIAATGDLSHDEPEGAYHLFRSAVEPLGLPVLCLPGNHDVRIAMRAVLASPPFHYCAAIRNQDWLLVGIDSCAEGKASGHVTDAELERLADLLAADGHGHAAVFLHHPPVQMGSRWLDTVGLENADEFLDVVCAARTVRTVVFGHVHQQFDRMVRGIRIIGTPSTCAQFLPGSDEFAMDDKPPAYRRIDLHHDGSVNTELVWLGADE